MPKSISVFAAILILASFNLMTVMGAEIMVNDDAPADYQSIQSAIDAAQEGDVIYVSAGIYTENIKIYKNNITLQGAGRELTQIEPIGEEATIIVEKASIGTISGFKISNTKATLTDDKAYPASIHLINSTFSLRENLIIGSRGPGVRVEGGHVDVESNLIQEGQTGIYVSKNASANISKNHILRNANHGVYVINSKASIDSNYIMNNRDGIAFLDKSEGAILYNIIHHNEGNGIWCRNVFAEITHNTLVANQGRAIFFDYDVTLYIRDNIIAYSKYGVYGERQQITLVIEYNDFWGNDDDYFNCQPGIMNISANPMFVSADEGDFRLYEGSTLIGLASDGGTIGAINEILPLSEARGIVSVVVEGSPAHPGDIITINMFGESEGDAYFRIEGFLENVPMMEIQPNKYRGEYKVEWGDDIYNQPVIVSLTKNRQIYEDDDSRVILDGTLIQSLQISGGPVYLGQPITVEITGMPHETATFIILGNDEPFPMKEISDGHYKGDYQVRWEDSVGRHNVIASLSSDKYSDEERDTFEIIHGALTSVTIIGSPAKAQENLIIKATGKSGIDIIADIVGIASGIPLKEESSILPGVYTGTYEVRQDDNVVNAIVMIHFNHNGGTFDIQANQRVTIDTIEPYIDIKTGNPTLRNGDTFVITLDSEEHAVVTADLSVLDTTQGIIVITEIEPGKYRKEIRINHSNLAINGEKKVKITVRDIAGNESTALLSVELMNPIAYSQNFSVSGHIMDTNGLLSNDAIVIVYNATTRSEIESAIDNEGNYTASFVGSETPVAEVGTLIYVSVVDGSEAKATARHYITKAEIDVGKTNIDLAITYLTIDPKTLPADGHSMALIEIRGIPKMPYVSASSGMIEQLLYDDSSGICTGVYTAGLSPGVVNLKAYIDGNVVATGEILLESAKGDISKISIKSLSNRVIVGKTVHITGMITPPLVSAFIELEVLTPTNLSWLERTQTRSGGTFDFHIPLNEPGTWRFCSFFGRVSSSVLVVHAEVQPYVSHLIDKWRTYTTNDGLADNQVEFMLEDRYGSLWAGTANGISKLEGETWINYGLEGEHIKYLLEDSNGFLWAGMWGGGVARLEGSTWVIYTMADGLSSDHITFMMEDSQGILWVGTWDGGLSKLENGLWKTYTTDNGLGYNQVSFLMEDRRGNLWVGTWGGGVSKLQGNKWRTYTTSDRLGSNQIWYLLEDSKDVIWAGTEDGLSKLEGERWRTYTNSDGLIGNSVRYLLEDSRGLLWIATGNGISKLDGDKWTNYDIEHGLRSWNIKYILEDDRGNIWLGTLGGVSRLEDKTWKTYTTSDGLGDDNARFLLEDSSGILWAITQNSGVSRMERETWRTYTDIDGLGSNVIKFILEDRRGRIWAVTETGLSKLEGKNWKTYTADDGPISSNIMCLLEDSRGIIWVATEDGLSKLEGERWENCPQYERLSVECLLEDSSGRLWVGTWGSGIGVLEGEEWRAYTKADGLGGNIVNFLLEDSYGSIWAAVGHSGLSRLKDEKWETYTTKQGLAGNWVNFLFQDSKGNLWAATDGGGLSKLEGENWKTYNTTYGIKDNLVNFLLEDGYGNLWAATKNGVSKLEAENWRTYTTADGLGHNYIYSLLNDSNGNLWAATDDGISRFVRDIDSWLSPMSRTSCKGIIEDRQGIFWIATDRGIFRYEPSTISPQTRITEGPMGVIGRASVSFGYIGEDLDTNRGELLYSWRLDNLSWSSFTKSSFVGISAEDGVHTFYVRASDNEGNMDYTPAKRTFRIDTTMPIAIIESPAANQIVRGKYNIIGTAMDETDFDEYGLTINLESEESKIFQKIGKYEVGKLGAGGLLANWDTTKAKDGIYIITLTVRDKVEGRDDTLHTRTINTTVAVDNTLPTAEIIYVKDKTPDDNKLSGEIQIEGQISDKHLAGYRIEYTKDKTINPLTKWSVIRQSLEPISESSYQVQESWSSASVGGDIILGLVAIDRAGNEFSNTTHLTLSNENPKLIARIEEPVDREVVGGENNLIIVFPTPGIDLVEYKLTLIETQQILRNQTKISITEDLKFNWDTTNLTDGKYTLELTALDSEGFISTHAVSIVVDNTPPTAKITSPLDKSQVGGVISFTGIAADTNFMDYVIEYEEASQPGIWMMVSEDARRTVIVNEGKLLEWNPGDKLGIFSLRLTVRDVVSHVSLDSVTIKVLPPIKSQEGGICFSNDGLATLYLPPRALPKDTAITINRIPNNEITSTPYNTRLLDLVYDIGPENVKLNPIKPVTLKVNLSSVLSQYQERIAFFRFDEEWIFLGGTVQGDKAVIGINQLGLHALMEIVGILETSEVDSLFTCQPRVISPERGETTISFSLKETTLVTIKVYSLNGRLERTIVSEETMYPGYNALIWDGKDEDGESVPSGLYLVALKVDTQAVKTKTIVVSNR